MFIRSQYIQNFGMIDNTEIVQIQARHVITIPKIVRDHMGIGEGDMIIFDLLADGSALVHRYIGHRWKKNNTTKHTGSGEEIIEERDDNGYGQKD